jgi:surface antigen
MSTTLDGARLKALTVSGAKISAQLTDLCVAASLSVGVDKVTEMGLTFQDSLDLDLFNSKLFTPGASVRYGDWFLTCDGLGLASGPAGPQVKINAPSKFVTALRKQTGAKSWGATPLTAWVAGVAKSVGMTSLVQPGLGTKSVARTAPQDGQTAESTWDVLTQQAKESGVWLFEYGSTLVFAKPSYLVKAVWPRRTWSLVWNHWADYSAGMAGMPQYADNPGAELRESMTVKLVSADADQARPGDAVVLTGRAVGPMGGTWIIRGVDFPLHVAGAVTLALQRPIDPKIEPPRSETAAKSTSSASASSGSGTATAGVAGAFDRFMSKYNGVVIDHDGSFGGQCVDLTMRYASELFGVNVNGNGNQWFGNGAASGAFTQIGAGATPLKGDIACWGSFYGGGYGHVAIVIADGGGSLRVLTQNPGAVHVDNLSKQGLQGYLRPKKAV